MERGDLVLVELEVLVLVEQQLHRILLFDVFGGGVGRCLGRAAHPARAAAPTHPSAATTHSASAARVLCRRSRPGDDEKQDGERTGNGVDHGSNAWRGVSRRLPNEYLYEHAGATAGTASRSRGTASTVLAGTIHVYRLWTVTLPVGPAT